MRILPRNRALRVIVIFMATIMLLLVAASLFLAFGGAKMIIQAALPAAMNGYITVDSLTYNVLGTAKARNLSMVLDWKGHQERVISAGELVAELKLWPLLRGRIEFHQVYVRGVDLNLHMLPSGIVNIDQLFRMEPKAGKPLFRVYPPQFSVAEDVSVSFPPFTYAPVEVQRVMFSFLPRTDPRVQLLGYGKLESNLLGIGNVLVSVDAEGKDYVVAYEGGYVELGYDLLQNIPLPPYIQVNRILLPSGRIRFNGIVVGRDGQVEFGKISVELAELGIASLQYPVVLSNGSGRLVYDGRMVSLEDFSGQLAVADSRATLTATGRLHEDGTQVLDLALQNLRITNDALAFLPTGNLRDVMLINGEASLTANVYNQPGWLVPRALVDLRFNGQASPIDYPIPVHNITALVRTEPRGTIVIDKLTAEIGEGPARSQISAGGTVDPIRDVAEVHFASPAIEIDNALLSRVPQVPPWMITNLLISGRLAVSGEFAHSAEENALDARVGLQSLDILMIQHPEVGLKDVTGSVQITQRRLQVTGLSARALGGTFRLDSELSYAPESGFFTGDLAMRDLDTSKLPREFVRRDLAGVVSGDISFEGTQLALPELKAHGTVSIRDGRLVELPVLISVINFLNLQLPGRVIFRSADARFRLEKEVVRVDRLELVSDVLSVYAKGRIALDGRLRLRVGVGYSRPILPKIPIVGPLLSAITGTIGKALTTVDVTGTVQNPTVTLVGAKYLLTPVTAVYNFFAETPEDELK